MTAILTVIVLIVIVLLTIAQPSEFLPALARSAAALTASGLFWLLYDKYLWRVGFFRFFGWLSPVPNLNGRWVGTVTRSENDDPHPFVIEIVQTFTSFQFQTFSRNSEGKSTSAVIMKMENANLFGVVATWSTKTKKLDGSGTKETFRGVSQWRVELIDKPGRIEDRMRIVDDYYTDRKTMGLVQVKWQSKKLLNGFGIDA